MSMPASITQDEGMIAKHATGKPGKSKYDETDATHETAEEDERTAPARDLELDGAACSTNVNASRALNDVLGHLFWGGGVFKVVSDHSQLCGPFLVKVLINFAKSRALSKSWGEPEESIGRGVHLEKRFCGIEPPFLYMPRRASIRIDSARTHRMPPNAFGLAIAAKSERAHVTGPAMFLNGTAAVKILLPSFLPSSLCSYEAPSLRPSRGSPQYRRQPSDQYTLHTAGIRALSESKPTGDRKACPYGASGCSVQQCSVAYACQPFITAARTAARTQRPPHSRGSLRRSSCRGSRTAEARTSLAARSVAGGGGGEQAWHRNSDTRRERRTARAFLRVQGRCGPDEREHCRSPLPRAVTASAGANVRPNAVCYRGVAFAHGVGSSPPRHAAQQHARSREAFLAGTRTTANDGKSPVNETGP
ncbi:hypothetical protein FB451DRAFT_1529692 [Mycena latifolia]|nr:hypothetical protein FB451DRAFT_1529692 [Mycena latifolia]